MTQPLIDAAPMDDWLHTMEIGLPHAWVLWHQKLHEVTGLLALRGGKVSDSDLAEAIEILTAVLDGMTRELRERTGSAVSHPDLCQDPIPTGPLRPPIPHQRLASGLSK